jgi:hypothetical protein
VKERLRTFVARTVSDAMATLLAAGLLAIVASGATLIWAYGGRDAVLPVWAMVTGSVAGLTALVLLWLQLREASTQSATEADLIARAVDELRQDHARLAKRADALEGANKPVPADHPFMLALAKRNQKQLAEVPIVGAVRALHRALREHLLDHDVPWAFAQMYNGYVEEAKRLFPSEGSLTRLPVARMSGSGIYAREDRSILLASVDQLLAIVTASSGGHAMNSAA